MIEAYWNEVFGEFKEASGKFNIPGLPEPLMSAHFGVQNLVGESTSEAKFKLCVFAPTSHLPKSLVKQESLINAMDSSLFWDTQKRLHPEAFDFITRLLPLLSKLKTPHHHFYILENDQIVASAFVGEADTGCFLFNLVVDPKMRQKGLGNLMFQAIQQAFSHKATFYWTRHPWFSLGALETYDLKLVLEAVPGK